MNTQTTKTLVKKRLRRQRKAFCWLKKNGHMAFRSDSKKHRKQLYKYYQDDTTTEPQFYVGGTYFNDWEKFLQNN